MAEKDIVEKTLEAYNDVFADIVNVLLFDGKEYVQEKDLEDALPRSHYKAKGKLRELERDVAKYWKQSNVRIAMFGNENQTHEDEYMPIRVIGYDGMEYRAQLIKSLEKEEKDDKKVKVPHFPVVTLVLYFGYKNHWRKPITLYECLDISEELRPYVSDYKINLFEIAYLSEEQVKMFKSDFRFVADYFVQMRKNNDYIPSTETIKHVQATLELMSVMTNDYRFEEAYNQVEGEEHLSMCEYLDRIVEKGRNEGIEQGKMQVLYELVQDHTLSWAEAAGRVAMTEDEFKEYIEMNIIK